jgi:hypothetical protein
VTVVHLKSAELGRWCIAINEAAALLSFGVVWVFDEAVLVATVEGDEQSEIGSMVCRALIEVHKALAPEVTERLADPTASILIAIALRDRLLDLLTETVVPITSRPGALNPENARRAYAAALGTALRDVLEREGPAAVRTLAETATI